MLCRIPQVGGTPSLLPHGKAGARQKSTLQDALGAAEVGNDQHDPDMHAKLHAAAAALGAAGTKAGRGRKRTAGAMLPQEEDEEAAAQRDPAVARIKQATAALQAEFAGVDEEALAVEEAREAEDAPRAVAGSKPGLLMGLKGLDRPTGQAAAAAVRPPKGPKGGLPLMAAVATASFQGPDRGRLSALQGAAPQKAPAAVRQAADAAAMGMHDYYGAEYGGGMEEDGMGLEVCAWCVYRSMCCNTGIAVMAECSAHMLVQLRRPHSYVSCLAVS